MKRIHYLFRLSCVRVGGIAVLGGWVTRGTPRFSRIAENIAGGSALYTVVFPFKVTTDQTSSFGLKPCKMASVTALPNPAKGGEGVSAGPFNGRRHHVQDGD
jgi:hypothetical protein